MPTPQDLAAFNIAHAAAATAVTCHVDDIVGEDKLVREIIDRAALYYQQSFSTVFYHALRDSEARRG